VQGPEKPIDAGSAADHSTAAGARPTRESGRRATLQPQRLAEIVGYATDPIAAAPDDLPSLVPEFTLVGGRALHDPGGLLGPDGVRDA
jgi:hypothetical protein